MCLPLCFNLDVTWILHVIIDVTHTKNSKFSKFSNFVNNAYFPEISIRHEIYKFGFEINLFIYRIQAHKYKFDSYTYKYVSSELIPPLDFAYNLGFHPISPFSSMKNFAN
jgi:hypothetical protein